MFKRLRLLVRTGSLKPAIARLIYAQHLMDAGKKISDGTAVWLRNGYPLDSIVFGGTHPMVKDPLSIPMRERYALRKAGFALAFDHRGALRFQRDFPEMRYQV